MSPSDKVDNRADLVGKIVWNLIRSEAPASGRSIFLLTGLDPHHLSGVSRMCPVFANRSLLLAISPRISPQQLSFLPKEHLSDDPPVRFRNSDTADIIVIAVPDWERDIVGTSLGEVTRIDRSRLQSENRLWRNEIKSANLGEHLPQSKCDWLDAMIQGLNSSGITKELDQFAEFIQEFISFPEGKLFTERLRKLGPVLSLPRGTFDSIPPESGSKQVTADDFKRMFRDADSRYSGISFLRDADDNRMDDEQILERVKHYSYLHKINEAKPDDPDPELLEAVEELVKNQSRLRRGDWLSCQEHLCASLDWSLHGEKLFGTRKHKKSKNLSEKTREHFEREYPDKLTEINGFLNALIDPQKSVSDEDKETFLSDYEDQIRHNKTLYEEWRRHLFPSTVKDEPDLLTAILNGAITVLIKNKEGDTGFNQEDFRFVLKVKDCDKVSTWETLDKRTYALFRHEAQLLSGALCDKIDFQFGKWLDAQCIEASEDQNRKDSRVIELEMSISVPNVADETKYQKVRIFWRPSLNGHNSISLAWPEDLEGLVEGMIDRIVEIPKGNITPKGTNKSHHFPISLLDTASFSDVCGGERGRTTDPANSPIEQDVFKKILDQLEDYTRRNILTNSAKVDLQNAVYAFRKTFSAAIRLIRYCPEKAYKANEIGEQARHFGHLCSKARSILADSTETRHTILRQICEFGIVGSATAQDTVIIPAWHPLRLLERMEKAREVATLLSILCDDYRVTVDGLERAYRKYSDMLALWCFPEIVSLDFKVFAAVEHCGGYSLAVPVDAKDGNMEALEASSKIATQQFMRVAEEYLTLNPHEENNFSTAIYNAETISLPSLIAENLESKMVGRESLRCSLLLTHDKPSKMREAYAQQTALLKGKNLGGAAGGFLSRLRVGVRTDTAAVRTSRRPDIDLVYLHEVFFRHSEIAWEFIPGESDRLPDYVDLTNNLLPRRQGGEEAGRSGARVVQVSLSPLKLPRQVAQFIDLCFAANKDARAMRTGHRAIPIRRICWDSIGVKSAIKNAHDLAEWVVIFDHLSSRDMLTGNDIKVIRDILVPGTEARLIVSSREPSRSLVRRIENKFGHMNAPVLSSDANRMANLAISTVVKVAGQKVLSAARSEKTALEIIGLAAATGIVLALQQKQKRDSVWFSLDDNRAIFGLREKVADTLAVTVRKQTTGDFIIDLTVVEAKSVSRDSLAAEAKSSRLQTLSTMKVLRNNFVEQEDPVARQAWGTDFLALLALRPEFSKLLPSRDDLIAFKDDLAKGVVKFTVQGRSVIVLHDDDTTDREIPGEISSEDPMLVQHRLGQRALANILTFLADTSTIDPIEIEDPLEIQFDMFKTKSSESEPKLHPECSPSPTGFKEKRVSHNAEDVSQTAFGITAKESSPFKGTSETPIDEYPPSQSIPAEFRKVLLKVANEVGSNEAKVTDNELVFVTTRKLQAALIGYGMQAEFMQNHFTSTPNGVIVRFKGHDTLTVKKVMARKDELKSTHALDVLDVRSGLGDVSFYIARTDRQIVSLADVWLRAAWPSPAPEQLTSFLIGTREDNGNPLWLNLTSEFGGNTQHGPHTLIAGETGSGKGVLIQNLLLQMVAFNNPKNLQLYVIDPKHGADFFWISEAPHLAGGISATQEDAEKVLESLVEEMERRYSLISGARTPNIAEYNFKVSPTERLPRIMVFHDEMADWMADSEDYRKMIQGKMTRIASKARACGMNVFLITQRASQDAIPVGIRDNLNNRLCLKVASKAGSELALKLAGGELLLGRGHLAANLSGDRPHGGEYFTAQVPFATTEQLEELGRAAISIWS